MLDFFTIPISDFEPSTIFSFFSNIAKICFVPFVLLPVWAFFKAHSFPYENYLLM